MNNGNMNKNDPLIDMTHGAGGKNMHRLIQNVFAKILGNEYLKEKHFYHSLPKGKLVLTTDSHVVSPLFFPGGDIGSLSMHGTLNDLAVMGAKPLYLTSAMILEEGFSIRDLEKIVSSMAQVQNESGVPIVTGDTKVVERGKCDGIYITTTGVGVLPVDRQELHPRRIAVGDHILVNGTLGDHGVAIMASRFDLKFTNPLHSDSCSLHFLIDGLLQEFSNIKFMQDPTRGGVAGTLNEIVESTGHSMLLFEDKLPIRPPVRGACEILGLDPLNVANEGKVILFVPPSDSEAVLTYLRSQPLAQQAQIIGQVIATPPSSSTPTLQLQTLYGGKRVITWAAGEPLPRIC